MAGELVLFYPKNGEFVAGIGRRKDNGGVEAIKAFKTWDEVREHAENLLKSGIGMINVGKKLADYYEQYCNSTEIPPTILDAFKEGGEDDRAKNG